MANVVSNLYQVMYQGMIIVSRNIIGMIPAVSMDSTAERVGLNQDITSPVVGDTPTQDIEPGNVSPQGSDLTPNTVSLRLTKQRKQTFYLTAEEQKALDSSGSYMPLTAQRFAKAFNALANELEADLAKEYVNASRAYGTIGTVPFGTGDDLTDLTEALRLLTDNGAPEFGRSAILNTAAAAKLLGKQPAMFKVNEAGDDMARRQAELSGLFNARLGVSGQLPQHVASTGVAGVMINQSTAPAGYAIGATALTVDGAGAGETLKAGDLLTLAGDDNKYVSASAKAASFTSVDIGAPGLREAAANNAALTVLGNYTPNMVFSMDAIHLATRLPALPEGGDMGEHMAMRDPFSGLTFELSIYRQYRQVLYEIALVWGWKTVQPAHIAILIG